jgi:superfamily II DNA or RNA helicase
VMVNYDLPWNPMQIEQRLGRIHRIGQEREVLVTNLVTGDTVEALVLRVLEAKINLFELVIGELDMILGRIEEDFDFERFVFEAHVASRDDEELAVRLEALGDDLSNARRQQLDSRASTDALVAEGR